MSIVPTALRPANGSALSARASARCAASTSGTGHLVHRNGAASSSSRSETRASRGRRGCIFLPRASAEGDANGRVVESGGSATTGASGTGGASGAGGASGGIARRSARINGSGRLNGKKKSALESALANIFDDNIAESEEAERRRWLRLSHSLWRAFLVLFVTPFVCAQSVKSVVVNPWLGAHWGRLNSSLNQQQRQNVATGIQRFEQRMYYDRIINGHSRLNADVEREMLVAEARRLEEIEKQKSFVATGNVIGSLIYITMTVTIVTLQKSNIARILGEISDEFISLDAATQAFILMLGADMVVGYHSSDGWQAVLATIITHYGIDFHKCEMAVRIFVAVVPVTLDVGFKYWVFNKLRKISPSTQIILGEIERH